MKGMTRPCRDCGTALRRAQGGRLGPARCVACLRRRSADRRAAKRESTARGNAGAPAMARPGGPVAVYGPRWPQVAAGVRARDRHTCRRCGRVWAAPEPAYAVDHLVPRRLFLRPDGTLDPAADGPANLVTLCPPCHGWKTSRAERQALRGDRHDLAGYLRAVQEEIPTSEHEGDHA